MEDDRKESVAEQLKTSFFARNGDFVEYRMHGASSSSSPSASSLPIERSLSTYDFLLSQWNEAVNHLNVSSKPQEDDRTFFRDWFQRLWTLHTAYATRYYHTVVHLEEMCYYLQLIYKTLYNQKIMGKETDYAKSIVLLAILFHDAIYDPQSNKNEEESAALFEAFAKDTNMNPSEKQDVVAYILATKHHTVEDDIGKSTTPEAIFDHPLLLFLDLDMAVLGKDERAYQQYAALIRREYEFVPLVTYCEKRVDILEAFLQQKQIFYTPVFHDAFEHRARLNLHKEIQSLREGKIPTRDNDCGSTF